MKIVIWISLLNSDKTVSKSNAEAAISELLMRFGICNFSSSHTHRVDALVCQLEVSGWNTDLGRNYGVLWTQIPPDYQNLS